MNFTAAFGLGAYSIIFEPRSGQSTKVKCVIWAYGPLKDGAYSTIPYTSGWQPDAQAAYDAALSLIWVDHAPAEMSSIDELDDLLA
jgi:hypothetical protein